MAGERVAVSLGDVCAVKQGRYLGPGDMSEAKTEQTPVPVIGANGILGYTDRPSYHEPVTLVTCRGSNCGLLQRTSGPTWISNNAMACPPRESHDSRYIHYVLQATEFGDVVTGSAQPQITTGHLNTKIVTITRDPDEQRAIAHVLGTLDDMIELNRETNEILEEMARAFFKSWFVDFDPVRAKLEGRPPAGMDAATAALFPDHFQDSELGQIPKGWDVKPLAEMIEVVKGRSYRSDELAPSTTALVTLKSFLRGGGYRADGLKSFTGEYKPSQVVRPGDLIVAFTDVTQAAEVIGKPALVRGDGQFQTLVASLDVGIVRTKTEFLPIPFLYCLFLTESFQAHTYAHSSGTTVLHLSKEALPSFPCVVPPKEIARKFGGIAGHIFNLIEENTAESRDLATLRDTLLPKLLSGEVSAPAAEELIAASK
jgi:type I restriction enzyme S subunit